MPNLPIPDDRYSGYTGVKDSGGISHCPLHGDGFFTNTEAAEFYRLGGTIGMLRQIEDRRRMACPICKSLLEAMSRVQPSSAD